MHRSPVVGILALILLGVAIVGYAEYRPHPEEPRALSVTIQIQNIRPLSAATVPEGMTALELLREVAAAEQFSIVEKEYPGLGAIVEQIGAYKNGTDKKYWTYTVNDVFAPVGAGAYALKDNDAIAWEFDIPEEY